MTAFENRQPATDIQPVTGPRSTIPTFRLLFLHTEDSPPWYRDLCAEIARFDFDVHSASGTEPINEAVRSRQPDAVVGPDARTSIEQFRLLRQGDDVTRPLCVLIGEPADEELHPDADLVLPPRAAGFGPLRTSLRFRAEAIRLRERNRALEREIDLQRQRVREQERLAEEVNLLKNTIVRNVSHELRTPILHLKSAVAMLAEDNRNNTLANYATEATARVEAIVKNIAQLASSLEIHLGPVLLREAIDQAIRALLRSWQHKDNTGRIRVHLEPNLPPVLADKQGLVTVVQLLLDNALKFSDKSVDVCAYQAGEMVSVAVCDYGIGIPMSELEKIFDSFYQVDGTSTRKYGGTGVGLAIVRLILDRHGIPIDVESRQGQGSTFVFRLQPAIMHPDSPSLSVQ